MNAARLKFIALPLCFLLTVRASADVPAKKGKIVGQVLEEGSRQPIVGANIVIEQTALGTSSGENGRFVIADVPVGTYTVRCSCVGYRPVRITDLVVGTGHPVQVEARLEEQSLSSVNEVVSIGSLFSQPKEVTASAYGLNYEEIRRAPGALGDVNRIIQSMPGVVPTNDQRNDLVVRGGSPSENLTIVDNVEVPNLSHFGTQGASGGPISMLNTEFIREANFLAGGFPAEYGGRLSSVLSVLLREGNRDNISGEFDLSFAGAGGIVEGPIGSRGSWMAAARRSFLDLIIGNYGLTAVPQYSNYQTKATYDLDPDNKLWFISIGGIDRIEFSSDKNSADDYSMLNIRSGGWRTISGLNWQMLWGKLGYAVLGVSDALDVFDQQVHDPNLQNRLVFRNASREGTTTVKYDAALRIGDAGEMIMGVEEKFLRTHLDVRQPVGLPDVWSAASNRPDTLFLNARPSFVQGSGYLQWSRTVIEGLDITAGVRYDRFGYNSEAWTLNPRFGLTCALSGVVSLHASVGRFSQMPPMVFLKAVPGNDLLPPIRADHYIVGLSAIPWPDVRVSLEAYIKRYSRYPVSSDHPTFSLANAGDDYSIAGYLFPLVGEGRGESRGIEFYVQKKLTDRFYGQLSYSFSQTRHAALDGVWRPGSFDIPHVLSLIGGYKLSEAWEVSSKFTFASGRPYTPLNQAASLAQNRLILDVARTNGERMADYHRLDLRVDYRAQFSGWNLVTYMELQNVYGRKNPFLYLWDERTGQQVIVHQIGFFPVGGFKIEF